MKMPERKKGPRGPNFIVMIADQMRADCIGCYGNSDVDTPNLDRLAGDGVKFTSAIAQNPTCTPSRASIITGRYPHNHGVLSNGIPLPEVERALPQMLAEAGYRTCACGKVHLRPHERSLEDRTWCLEYEGSGPYYGFQEVHLSDDYKLGEYLDFIEREHPEYLAAARDVDDEGKSRSGSCGCWRADLPPELHQTSWVTDQAIRFIESNREGPFFLWCGFTDPHHPFNPPEPYYSMYSPSETSLPWPGRCDLSKFPPHWQALGKSRSDWDEETWRKHLCLYYGMISLIDHNVGRLLRRLDELGLAEETFVLFCADHGELMGDHGLMFKGPYHLEALIRIPLIWRGPGVERGGSRGCVVEGVDIMATILDLAGRAVPEDAQGSSLVPLLKGEAETGKGAALTEFRPWWPFDGGPRPEGAERPCESMDVRTLRTDRWKLTYYAGRPYGELFDLENDPQELNNLWNEPSFHRMRNELMEQLLRRTVETQRPAARRIAAY